MRFIEQIVLHTKENISYTELKKYLFLFPSKRAVVLFNQLLQKAFNKHPFILPKVQTIQEFFIENAAYTIADEYTLLQKLYLINEEITQQSQPFHQFVGWGKLILKDFDEIDKYLVDAKRFFSVLQAHKEVEALFDINEIAEEYLKSFYANMQNEKQGIFFDDFIQTWKYLGEVYVKLEQYFLDENIAYEGKVYRWLLEEIKQQHKKLDYKKIHFCGFNAFTTCEEVLLDTLIEQYNVETWWDIDNDFMEQKYHEAGNFLRKYRQKYNNEKHHWIDDKVTDKQINIVALPSNVGQIHYMKNAMNTEENHCIVLCDENLLDYCLPVFDAENINITMGLSLRKTSLFETLLNYVNLLNNVVVSEKITYLKTEDVLSIFLSGLFDAQITNRKKIFDELYSAIEKIDITILYPFINKDLFQLLTEPFDCTTIFVRMLQFIELSDTEKTIKQSLKESICRIQATTKNKIIQIPKDVLVILQTYIGSQCIAFETKRDADVQIMGLLETRLQDFDNIFILGLNDAIFPGTNKTNSFIPYNLRKSFRLPTFDQFDGVNAYHFYRLLKRGKNISLIYNNSSIDNEEEKSRFIKQIEFEYDTNLVHQHQVVMRNNDDRKIDTNISINKTETIIEKLKLQTFSPSSLKLYLNCPVQFYLKYVVGIYEPKELYSKMDSAYFGTVLHKILELYYSDYPSRKVSIDIEKYFNLAIADDNIQLPKNYFSGKKTLDKKVIQKLVLSILKNDTETEFETIGLEKTYETEIQIGNRAIKIKGNLDRIDKVEENIRIIDYKTGNVKLLDFPDDEKTEAFFNKIFSMDNSGYPETFQGLMYAWLYSKNIGNSKNNATITVGFYLSKKLQGGIYYLNDGKPIPLFIIEKFEERLKNLLEEILNIDEPFRINSNSKSYKYSAYSELLGI